MQPRRNPARSKTRSTKAKAGDEVIVGAGLLRGRRADPSARSAPNVSRPRRLRRPDAEDRRLDELPTPILLMRTGRPAQLPRSRRTTHERGRRHLRHRRRPDRTGPGPVDRQNATAAVILQRDCAVRDSARSAPTAQARSRSADSAIEATGRRRGAQRDRDRDRIGIGRRSFAGYTGPVAPAASRSTSRTRSPTGGADPAPRRRRPASNGGGEHRRRQLELRHRRTRMAGTKSSTSAATRPRRPSSSTPPTATTARRPARRRSTPASPTSSAPLDLDGNAADPRAPLPTSAPTSSCRRPPAPPPARSSR